MHSATDRQTDDIIIAIAGPVGLLVV